MSDSSQVDYVGVSPRLGDAVGAPSGPVIIFGAGEGGQRARRSLADETHVLCFVDNDPGKHGTRVDGLLVQPPSSITDHPAARVIVASLYADDIVGQLLAAGISWDRVTIADETGPVRRLRDPLPLGCFAIVGGVLLAFAWAATVIVRAL